MVASVIYGRPYGKGSYVKLKTVTQTSVKLTAFQGKKFKAGTAWQFQAAAQKKQKNSWVSGKKTTLTVITTPETPSVVKTSSGKKQRQSTVEKTFQCNGLSGVPGKREKWKVCAGGNGEKVWKRISSAEKTGPEDGLLCESPQL